MKPPFNLAAMICMIVSITALLFEAIEWAIFFMLATVLMMLCTLDNKLTRLVLLLAMRQGLNSAGLANTSTPTETGTPPRENL